jgi:hypothetical protein
VTTRASEQRRTSFSAHFLHATSSRERRASASPAKTDSLSRWQAARLDVATQLASSVSVAPITVDTLWAPPSRVERAARKQRRFSLP